MIDIPRRRRMRVGVVRGILALTGLIVILLAYFVWTQPLETLRILVALNLLITGVSELLRAIFFPDFE